MVQLVRGLFSPAPQWCKVIFSPTFHVGFVILALQGVCACLGVIESRGVGHCEAAKRGFILTTMFLSQKVEAAWLLKMSVSSAQGTIYLKDF